MGTIDKNIVTLCCSSCGKSEILTAVEKGSVYGSSGWNDFNEAAYFNVTSEGGGMSEPHVVSAKCKKCNHNADIT